MPAGSRGRIDKNSRRAGAVHIITLYRSNRLNPLVRPALPIICDETADG